MRTDTSIVTHFPIAEIEFLKHHDRNVPPNQQLLNLKWTQHAPCHKGSNRVGAANWKNVTKQKKSSSKQSVHRRPGDSHEYSFIAVGKARTPIKVQIWLFCFFFFCFFSPAHHFVTWKNRNRTFPTLFGELHKRFAIIFRRGNKPRAAAAGETHKPQLSLPGAVRWWLGKPLFPLGEAEEKASSSGVVTRKLIKTEWWWVLRVFEVVSAVRVGEWNGLIGGMQANIFLFGVRRWPVW